MEKWDPGEMATVDMEEKGGEGRQGRQQSAVAAEGGKKCPQEKKVGGGGGGRRPQISLSEKWANGSGEKGWKEARGGKDDDDALVKGTGIAAQRREMELGKESYGGVEGGREKARLESAPNEPLPSSSFLL